MEKAWRIKHLAVVLCLAVASLSAASTPASALSPTVSVVTGDRHTCVLDAAGEVKCWGDNAYGQLGDGTTTDRYTPTVVSGALTFIAIAAGSRNTCGVATGGAAYCWGENGHGQIGDGSTQQRLTPTAVSGGLTFTAIAMGSNHSVCALTAGGAAHCWGRNTNGQLGDGTTTTPRTAPVAVTGGLTFSKVSVGSASACGYTPGGVGYCWGSSSNGRLGEGSTVGDFTSPQAISGGLVFSAISVGGSHACGVAAGVGYCWGFNGNSRLGDGTSTPRTAPWPITGGLTLNSIIAGAAHSCAVTTSGAGYCWGSNTQYQVGDGTVTSPKANPTAVSGGLVFSLIGAGLQHSCGLTTSGSTYCWGDNADGQIGNNTTTQYNAPTVAWVFAVDENSIVSVSVSPQLMFAVADNSGGSCNGVSHTAGTSAGATSVDLGRLSDVTLPFRSQNLTVNTNASNGFTVYARYGGKLAMGGDDIDDWSGTNAAPTASWSAGTEAFGYTTSDASLSTGAGAANRFTNPSARFAGLTTSNAEVSFVASGPASDTQCIGYQSGASTATKAGAYSTTIIYTAVPVF